MFEEGAAISVTDETYKHTYLPFYEAAEQESYQMLNFRH
jgi:hypothetical protein